MPSRPRGSSISHFGRSGCASSGRPLASTLRFLPDDSLLACVFYLTGTSAARKSYSAIHTVGQDSAPSVVAAEQIRAALADFDGNMANLLLCAPDSDDAKTAADAAAKRHKEIADGIVAAAQNITYGDNERIPISTMCEQLGGYEASMANARLLNTQGMQKEAVQMSRLATSAMHKTIFAAADTLSQVNANELAIASKKARTGLAGAILSLVISGGALLALLAYAQYYLTRRTHRIFNPGLLCASAATVALFGVCIAMNLRAATNLRIAVDDAFASVHQLWQLRAVAYDANADESRYLFDTQNAFDAEKQFDENTSSILDLPESVTAGQLLEAERKAASKPFAEQAAAAAAAVPSGAQGAFAKEFRNITFPGELKAAADALEAYNHYLSIDKEIRRLEKTGHHRDAVALCLSYAPTGSNGTFETFDKALDAAISVNQVEFDNSVRRGFAALAGSDFLIALAVLAISAAAITGFWPRLQEYRK